ncbi:MAG: hypothetical protein KAJ19_13150 [Gammaproteobacteria bacterium]|nr:hypothetical protein [Gammaproteobacteria bacterium]
MEAVNKALDKFKPEYRKNYIDQITHLFNSMVLEHGTFLSYRKLIDDHRYSGSYQQLVRPVLDIIDEKGEKVGSWSPSNEEGLHHVINVEKLAERAEAYAQGVVDTWKKKIADKLEKLEEVEVKFLNGGDLSIRGTRAGRVVRIEQQTVFKVSRNGLLFNQFPARIYVDGKFYPETKYKKLFA